MTMNIGLVGLPNVGKSTLFNALTKSSNAAAENFPFCTIDSNVGTVPIFDERLPKIAKIVGAQKIIFESIQFVDIAGLVKNAVEGEGLGNKFLAHIRECDAIAIVCRFFDDDNVIHVAGKINPADDLQVILTELLLADLQTAEKFLAKSKSGAKSGEKTAKKKAEFAEKVFKNLSDGKKISEMEIKEEEEKILKEIQFLTAKKIFFIANISESEIDNFDLELAKKKLQINDSSEILPICAKIESEISQLPEEEIEEFLQSMGMKISGLQKLTQVGKKILKIANFFTAGEKEARAWNIPINAPAEIAAGKIHSDFQKNFIRAEVVSTENFLKFGGWINCREKGVIRIEGRDAIISDGDICLFRVGK